jgi:TP901 family phage tail tape measure protein
MATILVEILGTSKQFKSDLAGVVASTERANSGFSKMAALAAGAGAILAGGLAVGLVKSVEAAGAFQASLNVLKAVTGATNVQMEKASKLAIALGNDAHLPAVSAKDAADAMLMLGKAGLTVVQSMGAARATLLLATAAETDNATAAKVVAQNLMAFHLSAKSASTIVDQMAGVMNNTGLVFAQFADSLTYTAAISHTVGQKFDDTATQIAVLARAGIEGSMAGTGLRTVLADLGNASSKASVNLKAMGVTTVDSHGSFVGMRSVIEQLAPSLDKMTKSQKLAFFQTNFGKYAMNAASIVLGEHAAAYDKVKLAIDRKGQADRLAASHMQGFTGAMAQLTNAVQTLEIEIGLKLLPVATRLALWLTAELPVAVAAATQAIAFLTPYFEQVKTVVGDVISAVRAHFDQIKSAVDGFVSALESAFKWAEQNKEIVMALGAAILTAGAGLLLYEGYQLAVAVATKIATVAQIAFNAVLDANPIGIVIIAIAALVGGLVLLYERSATARTIMNAAFSDIKVAAAAAFGWITNTGLPALTAAWRAVEPVVVGAVNGIIGAVKSIVSGIQQNWGTIKSIIVPPIEAAWNQVQLTFNTAKTVIINLVDGFKNLLEGHWGAAWGNLKAIVGAVFSQITGTISNLIQGLAATAGHLAEAIGSAMAQGIGRGFQAAYAALSDTVNSLTLGLVGDAKSKIKAQSPSQVWADEVGKPMADGIAVGFLEGTASLPATMSKSLQAAITAGRAVIQAAQATFQTAWSQMTSGADSAFSRLKGAVQTPAESKLSSLQSDKDELDRQTALTDAYSALRIATEAADSNAMLAAQKQVADAKYAIQVAALQKEADAQRIQLDARTALQQTHFDAALTNLQLHLAKGHATYAEAHKAILKLFKSFGVNYSAAGAELGTAFVQGLKDSIQEAAGKAGSLSGKLNDVAAGIHIPHAATGGFVSQTGLAVIHQGETITPAGQGGGNVNITINGYVSDEHLEQMRNLLIRRGRTTTGGALGGFA